MEFSRLIDEELTAVWGGSRAQIEAEIQHFKETEAKLQAVVSKAGFRNLKEFLRAKRNLVARLKGQRPIKYRRRTPEDEERILAMTGEGRKTKEIARELGLAPNTVSNVKKVLRDKGKL